MEHKFCNVCDGPLNHEELEQRLAEAEKIIHSAFDAGYSFKEYEMTKEYFAKYGVKE